MPCADCSPDATAMAAFHATYTPQNVVRRGETDTNVSVRAAFDHRNHERSRYRYNRSLLRVDAANAAARAAIGGRVAGLEMLAAGARARAVTSVPVVQQTSVPVQPHRMTSIV